MELLATTLTTVAILLTLMGVFLLWQRAVTYGFYCLGFAAGLLTLVGTVIHWLLAVSFCILTFWFLQTG